jgi:hypothetical protein
MATRSLSPKQTLERTQRHRQAVMMFARLAAKRAVQDQLRAQGVRVTLVLPAEIMRQAREYLDTHPELSASIRTCSAYGLCRPALCKSRDLLNTLAAVGEAGATFKSLGDQWADTTTAHGRLMLTVLGGLAEFERHLILARTSEGRQRAQQRGVRFGRKPKLTAHQQQEALARRAAGEALVDIAKSYAVSHSTISRL